MKGLISLLIVFAMMLMVVSTALADSPDREIIYYDEDYELGYCGDFGAGDFWIRNHEVGTERIDYFFDADGNWVKTKGHMSGTDHLYVAGSDKVVEGKYVRNWTASEDPETGLVFVHQRGNWWHINLPGYGNVIHEAGFLDELYDPGTDEWYFIREAGLRSLNPVPLCEYLAP
jgi:hypothetical protein